MRGGLDVVIGEGMNAFDLRLEGIALGRFAENNRQKLFEAMVEFVPFLGADLDQPLQAFRGEGGYRFRGDQFQGLFAIYLHDGLPWVEGEHACLGSKLEGGHS